MQTVLAILCVLFPLAAALPWHWNYNSASDDKTIQRAPPITSTDSSCKTISVNYEEDESEYIHLCSFPGSAEPCGITKMVPCCDNSSFEELLSVAVELNTVTYNTLIYRATNGLCYSLVPDVNACTDQPIEVLCEDPVHHLVVLGTGTRVTRVDPEIAQYLKRKGINLEVQDTPNACATFNFLLGEGRPAGAALIPPDHIPP